MSLFLIVCDMSSSRPEVLAVIPARLNSKSMYQKSIRPFGGRPLISYIIEASLGASTVTRTVVSTESPLIADIARSYGAEVPFMRPERLATDDVETNPVVEHAVAELARLENYRPDLVVWLQPPSPLCLSEDIDGTVSLFLEKDALLAMSVSPLHVHPYWAAKMDAEGKLSSFLSLSREALSVGRQKFPPAYHINGAAFVTAGNNLSVLIDNKYSDRTFGYFMPSERSVDVNTEIDFKMAELLLAERRKKSKQQKSPEYAVSRKI